MAENCLKLRLFISGLMLGASLCWPQPLLARFSDFDAEEIDSEQNQNTETWNDKNSYRYPYRWEKSWENVQFGYRVNAGSLNASRFNNMEDIVIAPEPLETVSFAFTQSRDQDLTENDTEREIRIGWAPFPVYRISILGDSDTFKEFGDIGAAIGFCEGTSGLMEFYYWSVDNYYASKKSDDAARRTHETKTFGMRTYHRSPNRGLNWKLKWEKDTPLEWSRPSRGWRYEYSRDFIDGRLESMILPTVTAYIAETAEIKHEGKSSLISSSLDPQYKFMTRRSSTTEIGTEHYSDQNHHRTIALMHVRRDVRYSYGGFSQDKTQWSESNGPQNVTRREWGFILNSYASLDERKGFQHGLYVNDVHLIEDRRRWDTVEIKYQALMDFRMGRLTLLGINTTWDVDQIVRDYPYSRRAPFRPWGGGDLQFMAMF